MAARFLQGLGGGAMTVALYVVVARIYAPIDHPRIFGAFAAAWVIPSMIGPSIAGAVAEAVGWRWVFLGVVALAAASTALLLPALRELVDNPEPSALATAVRLALAVVVAGAVVALDLAGRASAAIGFAAAAVALVVVLVAVRPLLPPGTLVVRRGLPAVIALRGAIAATFFATEIYLPYLLQEQYDVRPWLSGATLTVGALGWSGASQVQARLGARLDHHTALRVGALLLLAGVAGELRRDRAGADAGRRRRRLGAGRRRDGADVSRASRPSSSPPRPSASRAATAPRCRSRTPSVVPPRSRWPAWSSPRRARPPTWRRSSPRWRSRQRVAAGALLVSRRTA